MQSVDISSQADDLDISGFLGFLSYFPIAIATTNGFRINAVDFNNFIFFLLFWMKNRINVIHKTNTDEPRFTISAVICLSLSLVIFVVVIDIATWNIPIKSFLFEDGDHCRHQILH